MPAAATEPRLGFDVVVEQTGAELAAYPARHLQPKPGLFSIYRRPVFQVGDWNDEPWTKEQLAELERVHPLLVKFAHPWVTINHEEPAAAEQRVENKAELVTVETPEGLRAFLGFIARLYRNEQPYVTQDGRTVPPGELLLSDWVNVAPRLARAIQRQNFLRASVGLLMDADILGQTWPLVLEHISVEGEWEAVHTLEDLDRWYFDAGPSAGHRKTVTFQKGAITMAMTAEELVPRIESLEKGQSQIMDAVQNLSGTVQDIAKKVGATEEPPADLESEEEPAEEPGEGAELGAEDESEEAAAADPGAEDEEGEDEEPAAERPMTPAQFKRQFAQLEAKVEKKVEARLRRQFSGQVQALDQETKRLRREKDQETAARRSSEVRQFVKEHQKRIPPLLVPHVTWALEETAEQRVKQNGSARKFKRVDGKGELDVHDVLKLFVKNARPVIEEDEGSVLEDLQAPAADASDQGGQTEWNTHTCHAAVKKFQAAKKIGDYRAARRQFLAQMDLAEKRRFLAFEGKQPATA